MRTQIIACAAMAFFVGAAAAEELVKNGGFEEYDSTAARFASFEFAKKQDKYRTIFFSQSEPGKNGKSALKVVGAKTHPNNRQQMTMEQNIGALQAGKEYTLSFWAKGTGENAPEKLAAVEICQKRENGSSTAYNTVKIDLGSGEWKLHTLTFKCHAETAIGTLRIVTRNLADEDAFFVDDVSVLSTENKQ